MCTAKAIAHNRKEVDFRTEYASGRYGRLIQYWHKINNSEDLIRERNKERTKMCAKVLLALHRKDTKMLEEIFDQRLEPMSCELEPDNDIGHDYISHEPKLGKFINNGTQRMGGLTSGWLSLQTD